MVFEQHYSSLLKFLRKKLPSAELAHDIAQETYARVLTAAQSTNITNPHAFLFRTAENLCADYYRKAEYRLQNQMTNINELDPPAPAESYPDSELEKNRKLAQLNTAIAELPTRCREILILHKFEGYSHAEIADRFGISRNAVEKHIIKAVLRLRLQLSVEQEQQNK